MQARLLTSPICSSQAGPLPEHESALVLERFGVPFAPRARAATPAEAGRAAERLGFPVVVKLDGPAHKSREGGVVLDVTLGGGRGRRAQRLGGPVLVAKQVEAGPRCCAG